MSSINRKTKAGTFIDVSLAELQRVKNLEALRGYLIRENCFLNHQNAENAPITIDELKRLCRAWKLNDERNFWKLNPDSESLVAALIQHINDKGKVLHTKGPKANEEEKSNLEQQNESKMKSMSSSNAYTNSNNISTIEAKTYDGDSPKFGNLFGRKVST